MKFFTLRIPVLLLCSALLAAPAAARYDWTPDLQETWAAKLEAAQDQIDASTARLARARASYSEARHERHPRGPALAEIEQEFADAQQALEDAERELDALIEDARSAGVLPKVLRPYL